VKAHLAQGLPELAGRVTGVLVVVGLIVALTVLAFRRRATEWRSAASGAVHRRLPHARRIRAGCSLRHPHPSSSSLGRGCLIGASDLAEGAKVDKHLARLVVSCLVVIAACGSAPAAPIAASPRCERVPGDLITGLEDSMDLPISDPRTRSAKKREVTLRGARAVRSRQAITDRRLRRVAPALFFLSADLEGRGVGGYGGRATWAVTTEPNLAGGRVWFPLDSVARRYAEEGSLVGAERELGVNAATDGYQESRECVGSARGAR
jgi:hypothetical protein